jgi:hypothetical protein
LRSPPPAQQQLRLLAAGVALLRLRLRLSGVARGLVDVIHDALDGADHRRHLLHGQLDTRDVGDVHAAVRPVGGSGGLRLRVGHRRRPHAGHVRLREIRARVEVLVDLQRRLVDVLSHGPASVDERDDLVDRRRRRVARRAVGQEGPGQRVAHGERVEDHLRPQLTLQRALELQRLALELGLEALGADEEDAQLVQRRPQRRRAEGLVRALDRLLEEHGDVPLQL